MLSLGLQLGTRKIGESALTVPSPPSGVSVTAIGDQNVDISWTYITGVVWKIYYSTTPGGMKNLASGELGAPTGNVGGLNNGQTYWFTVTATNAMGESGYSDEVTATPLAPE